MDVQDLVELAHQVKHVALEEFVKVSVSPTALAETVEVMDVQVLVELAQEPTHVSTEFVLASLTVQEDNVAQMDVEVLAVAVQPERAVTLAVFVSLSVETQFVIPLPKPLPIVLKTAKFVEMAFVMAMRIVLPVLWIVHLFVEMEPVKQEKLHQTVVLIVQDVVMESANHLVESPSSTVRKIVEPVEIMFAISKLKIPFFVLKIVDIVVTEFVIQIREKTKSLVRLIAVQVFVEMGVVLPESLHKLAQLIVSHPIQTQVLSKSHSILLD